MVEISDILHKKLKDELLTPEENKRFVLWISTEENSLIFDDYKKIWKITKPNLQLLTPDVNFQWERFKFKKDRLNNRLSKTRNIYRAISAIAAVAILIVGLVVVINSISKKVTTYSTDASTLEVKLPDNSLVFLNKNSSLKVPKQFNNKTRTVELTGEALFEVEKNQNIPFIVELEEGLLVKVLGTTFNLRTYISDKTFELKVLAGKVVFEKDENHIIIEKGREISYNVATQSFSNSKPINKNMIAWHTKQFEFNNTPIEEVIVSLERYIGKTITMPKNISDVRYTGTFDNPTETEIAEVISLALGWNYKISKNSIVFKGKRK